MKSFIAVFTFIFAVIAHYGPLIDAAKAGNVDQMIKILNEGKGDGKEHYALEAAAYAGQVEAFDFLLSETDVDPSDNHYHVLNMILYAKKNQEAMIDLFLNSPKTKPSEIDLHYNIHGFQQAKSIAHLLKNTQLVPQRNRNELFKGLLIFDHSDDLLVAFEVLRDSRVFSTLNGFDYSHIVNQLKMNRKQDFIPKFNKMIITIWAERKCTEHQIEVNNRNCQRFISAVTNRQFQFVNYLEKKVKEEAHLTLSQYGEQCHLIDSEWNKIFTD